MQCENVPEYMTLLVRKDGKEYGIFSYGCGFRFRSIFPSDLFQFETMHGSVDEAIKHLSSIWKQGVNTAHKEFVGEMIRQREHTITAEYCLPC